MNPANALNGTAALFLALGDKTRLRLLNLMRDREVCVSYFTTVLGQSQPKVSRHLAYLRNAGVVDVRREGKWMHYSISANLDQNRQKLLFELFRWMEEQETLARDRDLLQRKFGDAGAVPEPPAVPVEKEPRKRTTAMARQSEYVEVHEVEMEAASETLDDMPTTISAPYLNEADDGTFERVHHNELEDFLL